MISGRDAAERDTYSTLLMFPQAQALAAALGAATKLTSLCVSYFSVEGDEEVEWGDALQQLTNPRELTLSVSPTDVDVLPLARLTQLTYLTLSSGSAMLS